MGGAMKAAQNALRKLRRPHAGCANDCSTTITSLVEKGQWFDVVNADRIKSINDFANFFAYKLIPEYNIRVQVYDGTGNACFKLPYKDVKILLKISCKDIVLHIEGPYAQELPALLYDLNGLDLLFLVDTRIEGSATSSSNVSDHDGYSVSEICHEKEILRMLQRGEHYFQFDEGQAKRALCLSVKENKLKVTKQHHAPGCID
ncbi:hypothetical protein AAZX31_20G051900 [Glycine max]|uniref:Uncharacterized protein n=1 Tax=Glycine soja TaxID=3848 RepID=A0A445F156_GLYSO|nr:uncharacterized protein LOC100780812 isoform X1 [Glycine max]XP_006605656.1 uncharacterized protein LOC100780812 isoform X1 [Glycine max]XP_006605657.1 uncharacterized protein LOC100780812 isoform X1 [Glycine max]XP_028221685.1 uncharacterized protein LOC114403124 [Glycine soja]XP_028221686.1 uncharacterized protein LOC114403124 [Glycine soja]XP_028221687.1 uncharacterized protein LOC114403124 [Glycine soja]KAG4394566.1 hypothetical protein GLYMA_20G059801v4 [Glycine max]KAH1189502.1 hypo|eukprot:XP_003555667.1 uncharacterized protein LOC100780812 isoform X1 [Glycine max]